MDAGQLVPDEVTINMVRDRLAEPDAGDGFLLDGFPRTTPQAVALDKLLAESLGVGLELVLELVVDDDEVIRRLSGRRTCRRCGKIWHVEFDAPTHESLCDRCGGDLFQRDDDKAETIAERLKVYARDTAPLVDYYGAQGKLVGIDATGPVEDVTVRAIDALRSYGGYLWAPAAASGRSSTRRPSSSPGCVPPDCSSPTCCPGCARRWRPGCPPVSWTPSPSR